MGGVEDLTWQQVPAVGKMGLAAEAEAEAQQEDLEPAAHRQEIDEAFHVFRWALNQDQDEFQIY